MTDGARLASTVGPGGPAARGQSRWTGRSRDSRATSLRPSARGAALTSTVPGARFRSRRPLHSSIGIAYLMRVRVQSCMSFRARRWVGRRGAAGAASGRGGSSLRVTCRDGPVSASRSGGHALRRTAPRRPPRRRRRHTQNAFENRAGRFGATLAIGLTAAGAALKGHRSV
jgi:hypothetical protein